MCQLTGSSLIHIMACRRRFGTKPLYEPMSTCCQYDRGSLEWNVYQTKKSIKMHMTISANVHTRICKYKNVRVLLVVWFIFSIYLNRLHINLWMQTYIAANPFNLFCVHIVLNGLHSSILWNTNPTRVKSKWNVYKCKAIWETKNMNIENEEEKQLYVLNKNHHLSAMNIHSR